MVAERMDRRSRGELIRLESRVSRDETSAVLIDIRRHARRIHLSVVAERPDLALHSAGAIVTLADRRLRQIGGGDAA